MFKKQISTVMGILIIVLLAGVVGVSILLLDQDTGWSEDKNFIEGDESMMEFTKEDAKKIIQQRIDAWKDENIDAYVSLLTSVSLVPETREDVKRLLEKQGFSSITEGVIIGIKELPFDLVNTFSGIADYSYAYKETRQYYVAIDYKINEENNYIKNGVNYYLYVFGLEDEGWFLVEASAIPVHRVVEAGYGLETPEEKKLIEQYSIDNRPLEEKEPEDVDGIKTEVLQISECEEKIYNQTCQEKCNGSGYSHGICKSFGIHPVGFEEKVNFEKNYYNMGKTKDCYVPQCPHPIVGVDTNCYCY